MRERMQSSRDESEPRNAVTRQRLRGFQGFREASKRSAEGENRDRAPSSSSTTANPSHEPTIVTGLESEGPKRRRHGARYTAFVSRLNGKAT